MAGTLTHFYVMKKYYESVGTPIPFGNSKHTNIAPQYAAGFLGSTGPDLFYMTGDLGYISDFHHYKNVGTFIRNIWENNNSNIAKNFCKGMICHMAADLVIHPFVNSLVGKYQEHIVTKVEIPGPMIPGGLTNTLSENFYAHNITEFAQDYYVLTKVFNMNKSSKAHSTLFTYGLKPKRDEMHRILIHAINDTYGNNGLKYISSYDSKLMLSTTHTFRGKDAKTIDEILDFYLDTNSITNIEDHVDLVLDDEYKNYNIFLEHQENINSTYTDENSTFEKLVNKAVELTNSICKDMENLNWDNIEKAWNLDTGLYTDCNIVNDKIKFKFDNYSIVW